MGRTVVFSHSPQTSMNRNAVTLRARQRYQNEPQLSNPDFSLLNVPRKYSCCSDVVFNPFTGVKVPSSIAIAKKRGSAIPQVLLHKNAQKYSPQSQSQSRKRMLVVRKRYMFRALCYKKGACTIHKRIEGNRRIQRTNEPPKKRNPSRLSHRRDER